MLLLKADTIIIMLCWEWQTFFTICRCKYHSRWCAGQKIRNNGQQKARMTQMLISQNWSKYINSGLIYRNKNNTSMNDNDHDKLWRLRSVKTGRSDYWVTTAGQMNRMKVGETEQRQGAEGNLWLGTWTYKNIKMDQTGNRKHRKVKNKPKTTSHKHNNGNILISRTENTLKDMEVWEIQRVYMFSGTKHHRNSKTMLAKYFSARHCDELYLLRHACLLSMKATLQQVASLHLAFILG